MNFGTIPSGESVFLDANVFVYDFGPEQLAELQAKFGELLDESERVDAVEDERYGLQSPSALPSDLADAKARHQRLLEAQKELAAADAARQREGLKTPAQLPSTDPDSTVLPNKEGGYAPNFTPTTAVDTHRDFIVDAEVLADANENTEVVPMTERVEEALGRRPEAVLADGLNATGPNSVELELRGIEFLSLAGAEEAKEGNPAVRADPRQPVPEEAWPKLPISPHTKKLDKSCFVFVPEEDLFVSMPMRRRSWNVESESITSKSRLKLPDRELLPAGQTVRPSPRPGRRADIRRRTGLVEPHALRGQGVDGRRFVERAAAAAQVAPAQVISQDQNDVGWRSSGAGRHCENEGDKPGAEKPLCIHLPSSLSSSTILAASSYW